LTDTLVFSHANGFPLPVYRRLLDALRPEFDSIGMLRFGHDPSRPVTTGWPYLVDELVEFVHAQPPQNGRTWLVGHSLGGYLSVLAAQRLHSRVAGIVLLDSPLISSVTAGALRLGRMMGLDRLVMPLQQTLQRRQHWPDADAAYAHYASKAAFARWDPRVLRDYADHCTVPDGRGQRTLLFDRDIEYRIYRSLPTARVTAAASRLDVPVAFIGGRGSRELRHIGLGATRALVGPRFAWTGGSHLFPMELPDETARLIRAAIDTMAKTTTTGEIG
jgi:pimeloyl-ACP methyl ester carboxylesterase